MSEAQETTTHNSTSGVSKAATVAVSASGKPSARTPARKKAKQLVRHLRGERPEYAYLKQVFRHLREELEVDPEKVPKKLPYIPTEEEIRSFYETVWKARRTQDVVLIKTLLYTGVRVSELINIRLRDVGFDRCQVRINEGKGKKDRVVPFPAAFKEALALHAAETERKGASYLFESSWKKKYTDRGIRKILARYAEAAGLERPISPHKYVGDDVTDEHAFEALAETSAGGLGIFVGEVDDPEAAGRTTSADYVLYTMEEVERFLDTLAR